MQLRPTIFFGSAALLCLSLANYKVNALDETCSIADADAIQEKYKASDLITMLQWSDLVYDYATIRKIVVNHDASLNPDSRDSVAFKKTDLVHTQQISKRKTSFDGTYLKYPVTVAGIHKFIESNQKYLVDDDGGIGFNDEGDGSVDTNGDGNADLLIVKRLKQLDKDFPGLQIIEFDDKYRKTELVYSIIINPKEERITVVFRGSVTLFDWLMDASLIKVTPEEIEEFSSSSVGVHAGFANYLFGNVGNSLFDDYGIGVSKFQQILSILNQIYSTKKFAKYKIYVTGHSLGGALTQLFAYALAGSSESAHLPKPIHAISYASPRVGNSYYLESFKELEKEGKLRHIRVSNDGDMVAVIPSVFYYQTGINLHVHPDRKVETGYLLDRSALSQAGIDSASMHSLKVYHQRLFKKENEHILGMSIEEMYAEYANLN